MRRIRLPGVPKGSSQPPAAPPSSSAFEVPWSGASPRISTLFATAAAAGSSSSAKSSGMRA
jgi:hypothetical protein